MHNSPMSDSRPSKWLFGPTPDLMLGCGLGYLLLFCAFAVAGPELRPKQASYLFPLLILLFSIPHYGATLLRVYETRADRRAYWLFSVWATLLVVAWLVTALKDGCHHLTSTMF